MAQACDIFILVLVNCLSIYHQLMIMVKHVMLFWVQLYPVEESFSGLYAVSVRLFHKNGIESSFQQLPVRTRGVTSYRISSELDMMEWNEAFVFKVDDVVSVLIFFIIFLYQRYSF